MTIHLPPELETSIRSLVLRGKFASEDDLVAAAVRSFLKQQATPSATPGTGSLGAMRDAASELDEVLEHAMNLRQRRWRLPHGE